MIWCLTETKRRSMNCRKRQVLKRTWALLNIFTSEIHLWILILGKLRIVRYKNSIFKVFLIKLDLWILYLQISDRNFRVYSLWLFPSKFLHSMMWPWSTSIGLRCFSPDTKTTLMLLKVYLCPTHFCTSQATNCHLEPWYKTFVWPIQKIFVVTFVNLTCRTVCFPTS